MKKIILSLIVFFSLTSSGAQTTDSLTNAKNSKKKPDYSIRESLEKMNIKKQAVKSLIVPGIFIVYGVVTLANDGLQKMNQNIREEIWLDHPHQLTHIDNYMLVAPALSVYLLNAAGIHGKNNFRDMTMIYLVSNLILTATVFPLKKITHRLRPDSSAYSAFPSGHTAEAFASAEFMRMEYKDVSPWYGIAGYTMAVATGYLRMYNNKHWFSDVLTGAGIGILSTKLAFWLYPKIQHKLFKDKHPNTIVMPVYKNNTFGVSMLHRF
jgi:membrane-associated phospholipid phosphatase